MPFGTKSAWQYSRWVNNIARNSVQTVPDGAYLAFLKVFLKVMWNPMTQTGSRPWLKDAFQRKAVQVPGDTDYQCDIDEQPPHVLVGLLTIVGRDFKKIPITDFEAIGVDILMGITGNLRYGTGPFFGSTSGSLVSIP